jgi:hypothetical protein
MGHRSFEIPAEVFLVGISLEGSPFAFLGPEDSFFVVLVSIIVPRVMGFKRPPPAAPHMGRRYK